MESQKCVRKACARNGQKPGLGDKGDKFDWLDKIYDSVAKKRYDRMQLCPRNWVFYLLSVLCCDILTSDGCYV